jgi:hypothetical protein
MNYKGQIYKVYTAQLHRQQLTCLEDEDDPFPSIVYKAQYTTSTDDTLQVYTREEHRCSRHGCRLLEAAIKHCIEKTEELVSRRTYLRYNQCFMTQGLITTTVDIGVGSRMNDALAVLVQSHSGLGST